MKQTFKLIPRFDYTYRFSDLYSSFKKFRNCQNDLLKGSFLDEIYFLNSGRSGLSMLIKAISKGEILRIGVQPFNCHTVFKAIADAGCIPVFIDINWNYTIDISSLKKNKNSIDILIVTHTFGIPAEMDTILTVMEGKYVIEDCAHAFLSRLRDIPCGTFGDAAVFSMNYGKFPSIGNGGFVKINNPGLKDGFNDHFHKLSKPGIIAEIVQPYKNYFFALAHKPLIYGGLIYPVFKNLDKRYDFLNKKGFSIRKGFKVNQNVFYNNLGRFEKINNIRTTKSLQLIGKLNSKLYTQEAGNNFYLIPILNQKRDQLYTLLLQKGYECGKHFSKSVEWAEEFGYQRGTCPVAEKTSREILVMPNIACLNEKDMDVISEILNKYSVT